MRVLSVSCGNLPALCFGYADISQQGDLPVVAEVSVVLRNAARFRLPLCSPPPQNGRPRWHRRKWSWGHAGDGVTAPGGSVGLVLGSNVGCDCSQDVLEFKESLLNQNLEVCTAEGHELFVSNISYLGFKIERFWDNNISLCAFYVGGYEIGQDRIESVCKLGFDYQRPVFNADVKAAFTRAVGSADYYCSAFRFGGYNGEPIARQFVNRRSEPVCPGTYEGICAISIDYTAVDLLISDRN